MNAADWTHFLMVITLLVHSNGFCIDDNFKVECEKKREYFEKQITYAAPIEVVLPEILNEKRPVLLLGEEHGTDKKFVFSQILPIIRRVSPELNCLALENFNLDTLIIFQALFNHDDSLLITPDNGISQEEQDVFRYVTSLGLHIYPIDDIDTSDGFIGDSFEDWVDYRNQFMVSQILSLLHSKQCTGVILSVGYAHLTTWSYHPQLDHRLTQNNIASHKILYLTPAVLGAKELRPQISQTWVWTKRPAIIENDNLLLNENDLVCKDSPKLPTKAIALPASQNNNAPIGIDTFSAEHPRIFGNYHDFEAVFLFPPESDQFVDDNQIAIDRLLDLGHSFY